MSHHDRSEFTTARNAGLAKRQATRVAGRTQCHHCGDTGTRCTGEVADPLAEVLLCTRHTALVLQYAIRVQARITRSAS